MPVLLTTPDEHDAWLRARIEEALRLQRPLPDDVLRTVAIVEPDAEWAPAGVATLLRKVPGLRRRAQPHGAASRGADANAKP
jgi:hypothetical protein